MAVTVRKVGELIGNEILGVGNAYVSSDFMAMLTNQDDHEDRDPSLAWIAMVKIGNGKTSRVVSVELAAFLSKNQYDASLENPILIPVNNSISSHAVFRNKFFSITPLPRHQSMIDEAVLRIKREIYAEEAELTSLKSYIANVEAAIEYQRTGAKREPIADDVKMVVWARDGGACIRCASKEQMHFDHIIPVAKGGNNLAENIQLLCQQCNLRKSDKIAF